MTRRLVEMRVSGTVRATEAGIEVALGEGVDAGPVVAELIRPARFAIRPEVTEGGEETRACPPGTGDCGTIRLGPVAFGNDALRDAKVDEDAEAPTVALSLTDEASHAFTRMTREQVGKRLAITVDGIVLTAPTVMEGITGGKVQLTLAPGTPKADAAALATVLRTPPLRGMWLIAAEQ